MKFIVEFHLKPGLRDKVLDDFEQRGPNRHPGVRFQGAWVGTRSDVIFALGESPEESLVVEACKSWSETGDYEVFPVIDIEQF